MASELPRIELGFAVQAGSQSPFRGVHLIAFNPAVLELRFFALPNVSVDTRVDWLHLVMSRGLTSSPRLPFEVWLHLHHPVSERWSRSVAVGLNTSIGSDAVVVDDRLAHRVGAQLALSAKAGFERHGKKDRHSFGGYVSTARGASWSRGEVQRKTRLVLETLFTWRLGS